MHSPNMPAEEASGKKAPKEATPEGKVIARKYLHSSYVCSLVLLVVFAIAAAGTLNVAVNTTYPIRQAIEWNWRARATNNLLDMATNLNRSIALLEPYHGNPAWIFPTADTDLDQIRLNIIESRDTALAVAASESIGSFGYQQAVQNLQETIVEINEHLDLAKGWFVRTPAAVVLALAYSVFTLFGAGYALAARAKDPALRSFAGALFGTIWILGSIVMLVLFLITP